MPTRPSDRRLRDDPVAIVLASTPLAIGALGSVFTVRSLPVWYRTLDKPDWNPPDRVFGPVWTTLYVLMGIAAARVWRSSRRRDQVRTALGLFGVQLGLNLAWSWLFFDRRRIDLALAEIVALDAVIAANALAFGRIRRDAGLLLVPYLAWSTFATVLNADIVLRNSGLPQG